MCEGQCLIAATSPKQMAQADRQVVAMVAAIDRCDFSGAGYRGEEEPFVSTAVVADLVSRQEPA